MVRVVSFRGSGVRLQPSEAVEVAFIARKSRPETLSALPQSGRDDTDDRRSGAPALLGPNVQTRHKKSYGACGAGELTCVKGYPQTVQHNDNRTHPHAHALSVNTLA